MGKHLERDLEGLKKEILIMGSLVEEAAYKSTASLIDRRPDLIEEVLLGDDRIDQKELQIEEECFKILALHQPVASDLRFVVSVMKVNNDLERMGDLAVNIAERAAHLAKTEPIDVPLDFRRMIELVRRMVRSSLDALVNQDTDLAKQVRELDDGVDDMNREMFHLLQQRMQEDPSSIERAVDTLSISRHLERIADLATNIAEDVVFLVDGDVIRHQHDDR
ncbi:MAG: phosphate signaling complex protein PhoU [Planctomycetota bacterium]